MFFELQPVSFQFVLFLNEVVIGEYDIIVLISV
jgi:hypothetical protein